MKKVFISRAVKKAVPVELLTEIYNIVSRLSAPEGCHLFCIQPQSEGLQIQHTICSTDCFYILEFCKNFGMSDDLEIIVYDSCEQMMLSLSTDLNKH